MLPFWLLIFDLTQQVLVSISDLMQQIFVVFLQMVSVYCTQNSPKVKMPVHEKVEINQIKTKMRKNDPFAGTVWIDGCACLLKFGCCWFEFSLALERECAWMSSRVSNCCHVKRYTKGANERWLKKLAKLQCAVYKLAKLQCAVYSVSLQVQETAETVS